MATASTIPQVILIGIAGPSGCGKTTYAKHLTNRLQSPFYLIQLDQFFYRETMINHPILGELQSLETPDTLDSASLLTLLRSIKQHPDKLTRYHREDASIKGKKHIHVVVEGFLLFALSHELTAMFDIRIFFDSAMSHCRIKRYRRRARIDERVPDEQVILPEEYQQWFEHLVWDEYLKRRDLQMSTADKIFHSNEYQNWQYAPLDSYIDQRSKEIVNPDA
jgi:uridine kinase